jgi:hypothetical protein
MVFISLFISCLTMVFSYFNVKRSSLNIPIGETIWDSESSMTGTIIITNKKYNSKASYNDSL